MGALVSRRASTSLSPWRFGQCFQVRDCGPTYSCLHLELSLQAIDDLFEVCLAGGTNHRAVGFDASPNLQVAVLSRERLRARASFSRSAGVFGVMSREISAGSIVWHPVRH